jgi:5-methylthioadenosine/S-adenosylhomocysteine deaminase
MHVSFTIYKNGRTYVLGRTSRFGSEHKRVNMTQRRGNMRTKVSSKYLIAEVEGEPVVIADGELVFEGDEIIFVGKHFADHVDRNLDATDSIVSPGFISTHSHLGGSPFDRSLREDVYDYWKTGLYDILMPIRAATDEAATRAATRATILELLKGGVTSVVDLTADHALTAEYAEESGIRAFIGQYVRTWVWDTDGVNVTYKHIGEAEQSRLVDEAVQLLQRYDGRDSNIQAILAPAQIDTCSVELLEEVSRLSQKHNAPVAIHAAQSAAEFNAILKSYSATPIEFLDRVGLLNQRTLIGHGLFIPGHSWLQYPYGDDLALLSESGATVAHCPTVFERHGQALENFYAYRKRGVRMSLGLDSAPHSMQAEMRIAGAIGRVLGRSEIGVTGLDIFEAATSAGARALQRQDIGKLAVGSKADFIQFKTDTVSMAPLRDPIKNIVHHSNPSDIRAVYVGGECRIQDGTSVYADEKEIATNLQTAAEGVWEKFPNGHSGSKTLDEISPRSLRTL